MEVEPWDILNLEQNILPLGSYWEAYYFQL